MQAQRPRVRKCPQTKELSGQWDYGIFSPSTFGTFINSVIYIKYMPLKRHSSYIQRIKVTFYYNPQGEDRPN